MKFITMGNGLYGELGFYRGKFSAADSILCADGGANYAYDLGWLPLAIIGDMDSIRPAVRQHFTDLGVSFKLLSCRKDETDTQAALNLAVEMGATEIVMLGSLGKRLDHALSNLYCGMTALRQGVKISHLAPGVCVYLVNKEVEISGEKGDLVSILALTDVVQGLTISGFEYPLHNVSLKKENPYAVSNVMIAQKGIITVQEGVLAVFHYWEAEI